MKGIDASNYYHQISLGNLSLGNLIPTTVRCFFFFLKWFHSWKWLKLQVVRHFFWVKSLLDGNTVKYVYIAWKSLYIVFSFRAHLQRSQSVLHLSLGSEELWEQYNWY